ncbi:conserved hypothetical protein [Desulfofarcimen acetoxidans DSM 771]|uniref:Uncharacterized protein n=1 Tax=Desulfofarcimen acetoxidans (strain ATCC 49208 / DSM 771 / KCTC 5769 / VKM B-1644 / 5575) TaxID=485916 RepID=C8VZH8_DESAS|nr:SUMF1/EgtB/PvdO family nonheme iron enzyme [Desulfofarcimen acetoxidans]ACV64923.1 conserved hypothetical protein [Desulfofarcimen acetoxidans DSM 771]
MSFVFSIKDTYRQAVEAMTGGKNTVMYDDKGNPSIMVCIPKGKISDVISGGPNVVHPAFLVDGAEKSEIWVSKYLNIIHDGRAYSIPGQKAAHSMSFDSARAACFAKGPGWHLFTNAEWSYIAHWCIANNYQPRGNDNYGASYEAPWEHGVKESDDKTLVGTGPVTWNHDSSHGGIADLRGNLIEWVDGLKLIDGRIYVHNNNNFNTGNAEGNIIGWVDAGKYMDIIGNTITLNDQLTAASGTKYHAFKSMAVANGVTVPDLLRYLAIYPPVDVSKIKDDRIYVDVTGERLPFRGGARSLGAGAGLLCLDLNSTRTTAYTFRGFRSAYVL